MAKLPSPISDVIEFKSSKDKIIVRVEDSKKFTEFALTLGNKIIEAADKAGVNLPNEKTGAAFLAEMVWELLIDDKAVIVLSDHDCKEKYLLSTKNGEPIFEKTKVSFQGHNEKNCQIITNDLFPDLLKPREKGE